MSTTIHHGFANRGKAKYLQSRLDIKFREVLSLSHLKKTKDRASNQQPTT
jgi:hypothetical protein